MFRGIKTKFRLKKISNDGGVVFKVCNSLSNLEHPFFEFNQGKWKAFELYVLNEETGKYELKKVFKKGERININDIKKIIR